ncbi:Site-specific recombinase XerD [Dyadobacter koreensis]|uniref:Site-specific recombinase XerD n=1 Tax=Dyadobacter koreensis TaxID=408657 RepID=A0A1H7AS45_9BACT|nr:site-specific integrase [Dyadobacter koreensis]SEJ68461.1 Site-specific recombinase XerD [Dyadobacter koreensis]
MLTKNFSLLFYLKRRSNYVSGNLPIYIRITINGQRVEITAQRECEPEKWNIAAGRKNGTKEDVRILNAYLDTLQAKIYEIHRRLVEADEEITAEIIRNHLNGTAAKSRFIIALFQEHNDRVANLVNKDFAPGTLSRYKTTLDHSRDFISWKYKADDIDIFKLNHEFITDFEYWLKSVRNIGHNTAIKYLATFKKIVIICIKNGWLPRDPFHAYKMSKREVDRTALTAEELSKISKKKFDHERLGQVRDIFLFCCYTGLAYIDVFKMSRSEIITGIDGEKWLVIKRQKTDSPSRIPLLPQALSILKKYDKDPQCEIKGQLLPVLSNQKMNSYLKEIAVLCRINKVITFHLARHTFATTVTLTNGVPMESVSKMLGHRNLKTTQQYAKIVDVKVSEDMKKLKQILK